MIEQRSPEWHAQRAGKFTGSRFVDVLARNKRTGEKTKAWHDLVWQVVVERMTGEAVEGPTGLALQWGQDVEPMARQFYELETGYQVLESEFIQHPDYEFVGCSPDGIVDSDGGLEMKCPKSSAVHLERFLTGIPEEYVPQVQGCMWVTDRDWWDFVSFDPRMKDEKLQMYRQRIFRDDQYIKKLELAVLEANSEALRLIEKLQAAA